MIDFLLTTTTSCYNVLYNKECCILCCVFKFVGYNETKILLRHIGKIIQFIAKFFLWQRCTGLSSIHKDFLGRNASSVIRYSLTEGARYIVYLAPSY